MPLCSSLSCHHTSFFFFSRPSVLFNFPSTLPPFFLIHTKLSFSFAFSFPPPNIFNETKIISTYTLSKSPMEMDSSENSTWLFDYGLMDDISAISGGDFPAPPHATIGFCWPSQSLQSSPNIGAEIDCSFGDTEGLKEAGSRKRLKSEACSGSGSKACREKLRRDKLNERFLELCLILEPGRPPKTDKVAIISDAVRMATQLRSDAQKLKESNKELQEKIKELKAEKNELRDEKQRLKADKEKLEQQVKVWSAAPGFLPHPSAAGAAFAAQGQAAGSKLMPFIGYPGVAMWQFMPPALVDTSQDHVLRPPVA